MFESPSFFLLSIFALIGSFSFFFTHFLKFLIQIHDWLNKKSNFSTLDKSKFLCMLKHPRLYTLDQLFRLLVHLKDGRDSDDRFRKQLTLKISAFWKGIIFD